MVALQNIGLPGLPSCQSQSVHAGSPMSKSCVSLGTISAVAVLINSAPAFKHTRKGLITAYQTMANNSISKEIHFISAGVGYFIGLGLCYQPIFPFAGPPFAQLLVFLHMTLSCSISANIMVLLAPVFVRPLETAFYLVWHPCCGLAQDLRGFFKGIGKQSRKRRHSKKHPEANNMDQLPFSF